MPHALTKLVYRVWQLLYGKSAKAAKSYFERYVVESLTLEQETICRLIGQVDALSQAVACIVISNPGLVLAREAIKADLDRLKARADQSPSDVFYAEGYEKLHLALKAHAEILQVAVDVSAAKSSGKIQ